MREQLAILNPCPKKWSDLEGEGRVRYCGVCRKNVHALDELTARERDQLWLESNGHLCGMLTRTSVEPARSRRAILVGALLTAVSPLLAQSGRVRIRVTDVTGAVVPGATVSLLRADDTASRTLKADQRGEAVFTDLPMGDSRISVTMPGFATLHRTVTIANSDEQRIDARLEVGTMGEVVLIEPVKQR
jgi:Carboxypeptidase regulatory-like domain